MATITRFEDLAIWKEARIIYNKVSHLASKLRREYKEFRLAEQMKSAAGSIMDNIAEGFERSSRLEMVNHLGYSKGECGELQSQFYRCLDDQYLTLPEFEEYHNCCILLNRKIGSMIRYLNASKIKGVKFKNRIK